MPKDTIENSVAELISDPMLLTYEESIAKAMTKYQSLFDSNMLGVAVTDFDDTILHANNAFLSIIGYSFEDIKSGSLRWSSITPSKYDTADTEKLKELMQNKTIVPFEKEYIHKKGHLVPVLVGGETVNEDFTLGVCFALDITQMKMLEQKKDDFIGFVSHELRTPLSIMKLYSDFLKSAITEGADKQELLESTHEISNQIDKLSILLTDLLNMARYKSTEDTSPVSAIDLCALVSGIVKELQLVHERNIHFSGGNTLFVKGNKERLSQVIINLINNAVRYSSADTDIQVLSEEDNGFVSIHVQDFGMGISSKEAEKIFERHYRINHADDYSDEGVGIGLYISKEIVKNHGGVLNVESEIGKGSTFTLTLPLI